MISKGHINYSNLIKYCWMHGPVIECLTTDPKVVRWNPGCAKSDFMFFTTHTMDKSTGWFVIQEVIIESDLAKL